LLLALAVPARTGVRVNYEAKKQAKLTRYKAWRHARPGVRHRSGGRGDGPAFSRPA
jgi:hypothetical protein